MSAVAVPRQTETPALEMPRENYLNDGYGIKSWLLTLDHKRIGILYMVSVSIFFLMGALFALTIRLELMTPAGDLLEAETYNKMFTYARGGHGLFRAHPGDSRDLGKFSDSSDDRRAGCRLPAAQSGELVCLYGRGNAGPYRGPLRWCRYRMDLLYTVQYGLFEYVM